MLAEVILWISIALLIYVYFGYAGILRLLIRLAPERRKAMAVKDLEYKPMVSIIVAAYNEERVIEQRIRDLLELDYPRDKLEIIIASDGSTDSTAAIARSYEACGVRVLEFKRRRGRACVHNDAVKAAAGEILVFTDAETMFAPNFLRNAVAYLGDKRYGCGSGDYSFRPRGEFGEAESLYWRMDKKLRRLEYQLGILPFASGGCFVIRKELYVPVPFYSDIDCCLPYSVLKNGYRVFYAADAKAYDVTTDNSVAYYRKRVRTALHAMDGALNALPGLIAKRKLSVIWVIISHRLLRWLGGYLMISALVSNIWLSARGLAVYDVLMLGQLIFYGLGFLGWLEERTKGRYSLPMGWHHLALNFIVSNAAFVQATIELARKNRVVYYEPVSHL